VSLRQSGSVCACEPRFGDVVGQLGGGEWIPAGLGGEERGEVGGWGLGRMVWARRWCTGLGGR
jgi:hypothetical protein